MKHLLYCSLLLLLTACTSVKQMTLLQGSTDQTQQPVYPEFVIESGDELHIAIQALSQEAAAPFNTATNVYVVDSNGQIELPNLGIFSMLGLTLNQVQETIAAKLQENLQKVFVTVSFHNASIVILGEVNKPQRLGITKPISIFEAIGAVNGLTTNARINAVEVLRNQNGQVTKYILDLSSSDVFQSPCYYLVKGDVVNVRPLHAVSSNK